MKSLQLGDTVLVQAAASGVGTVLLQLCKQWGFQSIATASTEAKLELARNLGADATINYTTHDFEAEVMRLTHGAGVHLALEAVGGEVTVKSMRLSEAVKAHAHLSNRGTLGKVLLIP
jgi:NADPH2:quinone reductase